MDLISVVFLLLFTLACCLVILASVLGAPRS